MGLFDSIFNKKASALKKVRIDRATINGKSIMTFYFKKSTQKKKLFFLNHFIQFMGSMVMEWKILLKTLLDSKNS